MTTTRKPSASKAGQARKAPTKKTTKPRVQAAAPAPEPQTPGAAANLLAMLVLLGLTAWALTMNRILPNQPAPARPAVHAPAVTKGAASCEAHNAELMAHGFPPDDCGAAK